ncbi:MAG TPA: CHAT domain-containing protein [Roseiflexaceae bacterium]|nr:CHAT domain-containing protein [Roseiflexaceae bacterium]
MIVTRSPHSKRAFQLHVHYWGIALRLGALDYDPHTCVFDLQTLQRDCQQRVHTIRDLEAAGLPAPLPDEGPVLGQGRRVAALLPPSARWLIAKVVRSSRRRRRGLRIVLEVANDAQEVLAVPWELLALPTAHAGTDNFLLLDANISLVRRVRGSGQQHEPLFDGPIRVQAFVAAPRHAPPIDGAGTLGGDGPLIAPPELALNWYSGPDTLGVIQQRLRATSPSVIHLLCHGERVDSGRGIRYSLLLSGAAGTAQRVGAADLARVLTLAPDLRLVVLQACHAGATAVQRQGGDGTVEGIALELLRAGTPAVVAMQGEVSQLAATAFVRACYDLLARGASLERAVAAGRIAMRSADAVVDWSFPVLYRG